MIDTMRQGPVLIFSGVIVLTYAWLAYSMLVLSSPMAAMLVYYPIFCYLGGSWIARNTAGFDALQNKIPRHAKPEFPLIFLSFIATAVLWLCTLLIRPGLIEPELITNGLDSLGMTVGKYWGPAGFLAIANPFAEEFLWRYGVLRFLMVRVSRNSAIIVSSLLFAGYHPLVVAMLFPAPWLVLIFAITFIGGIFLSHLYLRTRHLAYPIILHLVININLMVIGYLYAGGS